jgi:hypothetical protein
LFGVSTFWNVEKRAFLTTFQIAPRQFGRLGRKAERRSCSLKPVSALWHCKTRTAERIQPPRSPGDRAWLVHSFCESPKKLRDVTGKNYHKSARLRLTFMTGLDLAVSIRIWQSLSSKIAHLRTSQVLGKIDEGDQKESRPAMRLQCGNSAVDSSVDRGRRVQEGGVCEGRCRVLVTPALATAEAEP